MTPTSDINDSGINMYMETEELNGEENGIGIYNNGYSGSNKGHIGDNLINSAVL